MINEVKNANFSSYHAVSSVNLEPLDPLNDGRLLPIASLVFVPIGGGGVPLGVEGPRGGLGNTSKPPCEVTGARAGPGLMTAISLSPASAPAAGPWPDGPAEAPENPGADGELGPP